MAGSSGAVADPLGELLAEARRRLAGAEAIDAARDGAAYRITVRRGGAQVSGRLKAAFWEEYLASGRTDNCACVDHFFAHIAARIEE